jgi:hypothetical protein
MTDQEPASAQAEVSIDASPDSVYALITDLPTLASLAEEAAAMEWHKGAAAGPGAVFKGRNRNGVFRWSTKCTVTDAEPGQVGTGVRDRDAANAAHIKLTLQRLKDKAEAG